MPRGDRTGPFGAGPMTGRGMGFCAGYDTPGFATAGSGSWSVDDRGRAGRRVGRFGGGPGTSGGHGHRHQFYATGLTGWQRADRGMRARAGVSPGTPWAAAGAQGDELTDLRVQVERLGQQIDGIRDELARLEVK